MAILEAWKQAKCFSRSGRKETDFMYTNQQNTLQSWTQKSRTDRQQKQ